MSGVNGSQYVFYANQYIRMGDLTEAETADLLDRLYKIQNVREFGGPGAVDENININILGFEVNIHNPLADGWNSFWGNIGRTLLGWPEGTSGSMIGAANVMGGSTTGYASTAAGTGTAGALGNGQFYGLPYPVIVDRGGFGLQSTEVLDIAAPKLNQMEGKLQALREKLARGEDLSQSDMLQYQDLMQRMNQIFMWCQGCMQSEHEKNKNWAQTLGRI